MRKAGFLSTNQLVDKQGNTIFKPCSSVPQCFKDTFTHRGAERTRRVFLESKTLGSSLLPSTMRDWSPNDAVKCGIFGIWLSDANGNGANLMCPGTEPSTHYCCAVDVAVAPLLYLFDEHPETLSTLDRVCNTAFSYGSDVTDRSYPIFSRSNLESLVKRVGRYYAVPIGNGKQTIQQRMDMLNSILNEFSPPKGGFFFHL